MNFVAMDFETANSSRTSACSIGLCYVEDGKIVDTQYYLIRPEPFRFDKINILIHGITEKDVASAPTFTQLWDELLPELSGKTIVCHNAAFDMSVVRYCLDHIAVPYPNLDYLCTLRLAQAVEPNVGCYKLDYLCLKYSIDLLHHNAMSDAEACAKLFLKLCEISGVSGIKELIKNKLVSLGRLYPGGYRPCSGNYNNVSQLSKTNLQDLEIIHIDDDLFGKNFVFTGSLTSMSRDIASKLVTQGGGVIQNSVTLQTNYLVSGMQNPIALRGNKISTKFKKALRLAEQGQDIQIIQEDDFLKMIDSELWGKFFQTM